MEEREKRFKRIEDKNANKPFANGKGTTVGGIREWWETRGGKKELK